MQKSLVRKGLVFGIICLFVGASILPSIGGNIVEKHRPINNRELLLNYDNRGDTLYVGGSGPGNYTTIQEAVNDASAGDTIFVYNGIYYESHIIINRSMNIIGENKEKTVITDGSGAKILLITGNNVNISGFTIKEGYMGIGIYSTSTKNTISNNLFTSNSKYGIYLSSNEHNTIQENIFSDCGADYGDAISLQYSNNNIIYGNSFSNCGISVSTSYHNFVENNSVNDKPLVYIEEKSDFDITVNAGQIILINSENVRIKNQNISSINLGIIVYSSNNCLLQNNTITYANIGIYVYQSNGNDIIENNISFCTNGIVFGESHNNIISNNCIFSNNQYGLYFYVEPLVFASNNNSIMFNIIKNNNKGICLISSNFTKILYNVFTRNDKAIRIYYTKNTSINENNFIENRKDAYFNRCFTNNWNNNYWDRFRFLPKPIFGLKTGKLFPITIGIEFDRNPAQEPYDIPAV